MHHLRPIHACVVAMILVFFSANPRESNASDDTRLDELAKQRCEYERTMESIRADTKSAIDQADADQLSAFLSTGAWPECEGSPSLKRRAANATKAMQAKFQSIVDRLNKASKDALRDAVAAEFEQFLSQNDVVPWRENLIAQVADADRTLNPASEPMTVTPEIDPEYRLEVNAKRLTEAGTLKVEFPLADGQRLTLPILASKDNEFRALLSVRAGLVSADLGLARPIDLNAAFESECRSVTLRADDGQFLVECIRTKPIIPGRPEQIATRATPTPKRAPPPNQGRQVEPKQKKEKAPPEDGFFKGKIWRGEWEPKGAVQPEGCEVEVLERNDGKAVLRVQTDKNHRFRLEGDVRDGVFELKIFKQMYPTGVEFRDEQGSARVRKGILFLSLHAKRSQGNNHNQPFDMDIEGEQK